MLKIDRSPHDAQILEMLVHAPSKFYCRRCFPEAYGDSCSAGRKAKNVNAVFGIADDEIARIDGSV